MSSIRSALYQVKRQLVLNRLFSVFLDSLLVFFAGAILLALLMMPWFYAGIPMILYFIPMSVKRVREVRLKEAEEKIPELQWQLRTTEDTLGKENEIVESLHQRVLQRLMAIRKSYLMDGKAMRYKFAGIIGLVGIFFVISFFNFALLDAANPNGITGLLAKDGKNGFGAGNDSLLKTNAGDRDIYGEKDVAELGDEELQLELKKQNNELDYNNIKDPEGKNFNQQKSLGDIGASADASYKENIDEENKKLVKNYFEKLSQEK